MAYATVAQRMEDREAPEEVPTGKKAKLEEQVPAAEPSPSVKKLVESKNEPVELDIELFHSPSMLLKTAKSEFFGESGNVTKFRGHLFATAGFSEYGGKSYNIILSKKKGAVVKLVNLARGKTVEKLLKIAKAENQVVYDIVVNKSGARETAKGWEFASQWKTASGDDQKLADWFQAKGLDGWFMVLGYNEYMVTEAAVHHKMMCVDIRNFEGKSKVRSK